MDVHEGESPVEPPSFSLQPSSFLSSAIYSFNFNPLLGLLSQSPSSSSLSHHNPFLVSLKFFHCRLLHRRPRRPHHRPSIVLIRHRPLRSSRLRPHHRPRHHPFLRLLPRLSRLSLTISVARVIPLSLPHSSTTLPPSSSPRQTTPPNRRLHQNAPSNSIKLLAPLNSIPSSSSPIRRRGSPGETMLLLPASQINFCLPELSWDVPPSSPPSSSSSSSSFLLYFFLPPFPPPPPSSSSSHSSSFLLLLLPPLPPQPPANPTLF